MEYLPVELILDIADYLPPADAMSFLLTTSRHRKILLPRIEKKYKSIVLGDLLPPVPATPWMHRRRPDLLPIYDPDSMTGIITNYFADFIGHVLDSDVLQEYEELFVALVRYKSFAMIIKSLTIDYMYDYTCMKLWEKDGSGLSPESREILEVITQMLLARPFASIRSEMTVPWTLQHTKKNLDYSSLTRSIKQIHDGRDSSMPNTWITVLSGRYQYHRLTEFIISLCKNVETLRLTMTGSAETDFTANVFELPLENRGPDSIYNDYLGRLKSLEIVVRERKDKLEAFILVQRMSEELPWLNTARIIQSKIEELPSPVTGEAEQSCPRRFIFTDTITTVLDRQVFAASLRHGCVWSG